MKIILPTIILCAIIILTSSYTTNHSPSAIAKQLVFPVTGNNANVGSVWGDEREGGRRKHEGVDIFAGRGTPVVAVSDGVIDVVRTDELGGNNITLQPDDYSWNAYYAHLDKMYVQHGDRVKKGQLIGTVGNTGNAKTTPPHLHFGIYTTNGATDPLPYIQSSPRISSPVVGTASSKNSPKKTSSGQQTGTASKKNNGGRPVETAIKNAAVQVITGELLRRIKIRL